MEMLLIFLVGLFIFGLTKQQRDFIGDCIGYVIIAILAFFWLVDLTEGLLWQNPTSKKPTPSDWEISRCEQEKKDAPRRLKELKENLDWVNSLPLEDQQNIKAIKEHKPKVERKIAYYEALDLNKDCTLP